jgi:hypothetical protein
MLSPPIALHQSIKPFSKRISLFLLLLQPFFFISSIHAATTPNNAVLQRSLINESIESIRFNPAFSWNPGTGTETHDLNRFNLKKYVYINQWDTTGNSSWTVDSGKGLYGWKTTDAYGVIEVWQSPGPGSWQGLHPGKTFTPKEGKYSVELNSVTNSFLYQTVCLIPGETIKWKFSHATLNNSSPETAQLRIETPSGALVQTLASQTSPVGGDWYENSGTTTFQGATANFYRIGFRATGYNVNGAGVYASDAGNELDDIHVQLAPYIQLSEEQTPINNDLTGTIKILIAGEVSADSYVYFNVVSGPTDLVLINNQTLDQNNRIKVPKGSYDGSSNTAITVPFSLARYVPNQKIIVRMVVPNSSSLNPANLKQTSVSVCGDDRFIDRDIEFPYLPPICPTTADHGATNKNPKPFEPNGCVCEKKYHYNDQANTCDLGSTTKIKQTRIL